MKTEIHWGSDQLVFIESEKESKLFGEKIMSVLAKLSICQLIWLLTARDPTVPIKQM